MGQQSLVILTLVSLTALAGCGNRAKAPPRAQSMKTEPRPVRVVGVLAPREGLTIPAGTKVEVVVRRDDYPDQVLAVYALSEVRHWPARFEIAVKWPNVPAEGEEVTWKASPPVLSVLARGAVAGQAAYISESQRYTAEDSVSGRPTNLVLVPTRE